MQLLRCVVLVQDQTAARVRGEPHFLLLQQRLAVAEVSEYFENETAMGSFETCWCSMARELQEWAMWSCQCRFYRGNQLGDAPGVLHWSEMAKVVPLHKRAARYCISKWLGKRGGGHGNHFA